MYKTKQEFMRKKALQNVDFSPCKGRIFAVKSGYNPNSSSIGSQIHLFIISSLVTGGIALAILHIFTTVRMKIDKMKSSIKDEKNGYRQETANR